MKYNSNSIVESLSQPIKNTIRRTYNRIRSLPKRFKNASIAFRTHNASSRLEIDRFASFEVAYRKGTADESVIKHSFENDIFFSATPEYVPEPDHIIIDVGAHIGTFSLLAASKVPEGKVYAIEACRETCNYLNVNVMINNFSNVEVSHLALGESKGRCKLYYAEDNWGHSLIRTVSKYGEEVPSDTLSNFVTEKSIVHCHFMKLNVEGAEFRILLSTPEEILRRFWIILVLYHCDLVHYHNEKDLEAHLQKCGFSTTFRHKTTFRGWLIARNARAGQL